MEWKSVCASVLFIGIVSVINGQSNINDLDANELGKKINEISGFEQFNSSKLPSEEEVEKALREKCDKNGGGEEAFNALKNQQSLVQECVEQQLNFTQIQLELEEAKKTGSMDEVFGKYCKKYPEVYKCFADVTEKVKLCMDPQEQDALKITLNVTDELSEFLCFKDGDRIAMFVAEGGFECLQERKDALQECANKTIGARLPTDLSVSSLPTFIFSERDCSDFDKIRMCFNTELEQCKSSTPANIIDAFFKFLKRHTPCKDKGASISAPSESTIGKASGIFSPSYLIFTLSLISVVISKSYFLH